MKSGYFLASDCSTSQASSGAAGEALSGDLRCVQRSGLVATEARAPTAAKGHREHLLDHSEVFCIGLGFFVFCIGFPFGEYVPRTSQETGCTDAASSRFGLILGWIWIRLIWLDSGLA